MSVQKTYILLAAEISSLKKDLEITEKLMNLATSEFKKEVSRLTGLKVVEEKKEISGKTKSTNTEGKKEENRNSNPPPEVEKQVIKTKDPNQRSLFKKIASIAHPDKISKVSEFEKKLKDGLFESARTAVEEDDYHEICEIAEKLQINLPLPTE